VEVQNIKSLYEKLAKLGKKYSNEPTVVVGYTQNYAIFVHENMTAHHPVGQAKFLEQPARTMQDELKKIIRDAMKNGADLGKALLMAGLRLQRESQKLCPVETGALRASAFTKRLS
jgi:hypothetical protein